jgi:hypothetical protein
LEAQVEKCPAVRRAFSNQNLVSGRQRHVARHEQAVVPASHCELAAIGRAEPNAANLTTSIHHWK